MQRKVSVAAGFSPEIQALRALAVMLVVIFHFWPHALPGGYVGVDVFFVISGFLITGHLVREVQRTGSLSLPAFWARRIRRLLPAALLVLIVTVAAAVIWMPIQRWPQVLNGFWSSLGLVQNWTLAFGAIDYFNSDTQVSPLQHYWSLSVEEQFYLVWPVLLVLIAVLVRRSSRIRLVPVFATVVIVIGLASFVWSVIDTRMAPAFAYFSTLTHAWEFVVGGLLACVAPRLTALARSHRWIGHPAVSVTLLVFGVALIAIPGFRFTGATAFPGWIAIVPITGAALVLLASVIGELGIVRRVVAFRPIALVGDISYSLYLWHWPLVIFAPLILARALTTVDRVMLVAIAIAFAWLTKIAVEDPVRRGTLSRRAPQWTYAVALATALLAVGVSVIPAQAYQSAKVQAVALIKQLDAEHARGNTGCYAAAAPLNSDPLACPNSHVINDQEKSAGAWLSQVDDPAAAGRWDASWGTCKTALGSTISPCRFGSGSPATNIQIVGDSHGFQWVHAILPIAQAHSWSATINWQAGCGLELTGLQSDANRPPTGCDRWTNAITQQLLSDPTVKVIALSTFAQGHTRQASPQRLLAMQAGYADLYRRLAAAGKQVIVFADAPLPGFNVPDCIASSKTAVDPCTVPRSVALHGDPMADAARAVNLPSVQLLDFTRLFCDTTCHTVIGGIPAYGDSHHVSAAFVRSLEPVIETAIMKAVAASLAQN